MGSVLPINIRDLLYCRGVEQQRVEFKKAWNDGPTASQVVKSLCAFANDYHNVNGGYILLGVEEDASGIAKLPPVGLKQAELDTIQKKIRGIANRIDPVYQPLICPEVVDGAHILVLWAPGSDNRPHQAPVSAKSGERKYYVRLGSETCEAKGNILTTLLAMTAKVPFDDRRANSAQISDIRTTLVREFLRDVRSGLLHEEEDAEIYRRMRLTARVNSHEVPRNAALLFFSDDPERMFRGARIEVVNFADDAGGDVIEEQTFRGPLTHQVRRCIDYLRNFAVSHLHKVDDHAEVQGWVSYPLPALEEVIVNAVYHRSYEDTQEPVKVYLYSDRIEVTSYPGPVPGLEQEHFDSGAHPPQVPARNRRIGEFLKELKLAEQRGTGIPKVYRAMSQNGSPKPSFSFDKERTYFRVLLPAHPEYVALSALRDAAHLEALGDHDAGLRRIRDAFEKSRGSGILASRLIELYANRDDLPGARDVFKHFLAQDRRSSEAHAIGAMAGTLLDADQAPEARKILDRLPAVLSYRNAIKLAIQERRAGRESKAHQLFERAGDAVLKDPQALLEFAQSKARLASEITVQTKPQEQARTKLLREVRDMLQRVIQLDAAPLRHAWAWQELGYVLDQLNEPRSGVIAAFEKATALAPDEQRFQKSLARAKAGTLRQGPRRKPRRRRKK